MNIEQVKKDYWEVMIQPFTQRTDRSFYEIYHRKIGKIYTSLASHSKEERDEIMFDRSIELLLEHYPHYSPLSETDKKELLGVFISKVSNTEGSKVSWKCRNKNAVRMGDLKRLFGCYHQPPSETPIKSGGC